MPAPPDADAVLAELDPEQREVATALTGPVCVLAGAGTGKTRAITHRIAYGVLSGAYAASHVLAVTFTARAAGELRGRLRGLGVPGVQARTFHAAALRQVQYFWPRAIGGAAPEVLAQKVPVLAEAAGRLGLRPARADLRDLAAELEWAKVGLISADGYPAAAERAGRTPPAGLDPAAMARLIGGYEQLKLDRGLMDFEDVLLYAAALIADHRDVADAVRSQYRHLVVDEFQDVSPVQAQLLEQWLGGREELCVVGDPGQTIYSFAGASPSYLLDFGRAHPGARVIRLVRDYRSTPQVVGLANKVLGPGAHSGVQLQAQRPAGPEPALAEYADEPAEAAAVATRIAALVAGGIPRRDIAVLFRTNGQSEAYEEALADAGIPYVLRGAERFFDRSEVRQAHLLLRGAARAEPEDQPLPDAVRAVLGSLGWSPTPPAGAGAARDRWESLAALVEVAETLVAADPAADLAALVAELDERAASAHAPSLDAVTLASLHAAKGLEWDAVFLVGLTDGMLPITYASTPAAIEEERRLLYVGITRARTHLQLSWSKARTPGGAATRRPSRFLDPVLDTRPGARPGASAGRNSSTRSRRRGPVTCRICGRALTGAVERKLGRCAGCPSDVDEGLVERLRAWRLERSRAASVPAYVVFTDATLTAIAQTRPASREELAGVPGVGARKLDSYGDEVLEIVAAGPD